MEHAANLFQQTAHNMKQKPQLSIATQCKKQSLKPGFTKIAKKNPRIIKLWSELTALYAGAFTGSYGKTIDETGVWEMTLSLLSDEDIAFGLKKLMLDDSYQQFPPNPKQFKTLCIDRQRVLGLPNTRDAYLEAKMFFDSKTHIWSHHAVKFSAVKVGEELLISAREQVAWPRFKEIYERAVLAVKNGIQLPKIDNKEESRQINLAVGRHYLNQIKQQLHGA